ncbi:MAG: PIG-L deacetylase family protein [Pirellulaceae bacterium]
MRKTVFAIGAHPDDIEFVMAGTLLQLQAVGFEVHYMNVANGCCGSTVTDAQETAAIRLDESRQAANLIGAIHHPSIANDLEILYDLTLLRKLAAIIREVSPAVILTHSPQDYMEDHVNTCRLVVTAAFARGMPNFQVAPSTPITDTPVTLYHAQPHGNCDALGQPIVPSLFVDVTDTMDTKAKMLACHASQKRWLDESQGMNSYIDSMRQLSQAVGALSRKFAYAEGWRRHSHLGFCNESDDPLSESLPPPIIHRIVPNEVD